MIKRLLLALALFVAAPAYAQELNSDTNCTNAGAWSAATGWTAGSGCVASGATGMKMLMQMNSAIKHGHRYKISFTVSGYSAGLVRAFVGLSMPIPPTGSFVTEASTTDIPDNFTPAIGTGMRAGASPTEFGPYGANAGPGNSGEANGAWRFNCNSAGFGWIDPLVFPGLHTSHLHEFIGASNIQNNWTTTDFRTKAESTCASSKNPKYALNRSGYWWPAFVDGQGHIIRNAFTLVYYKGPASATLHTSIAVSGSVSGNVLTVTSAPPAGTGISIGNLISPCGGTVASAQAGAQIGSVGTGTGGTGTYNLTSSPGNCSGTITVVATYTAGPVSDITNLCAQSANLAAGGSCQNVPRFLRYTFGYDFGNCTSVDQCNVTTGTGQCGPLDTANNCTIHNHSTYYCVGGPNNEGSTSGNPYTSVYYTLADIMNASVCVTGSWVHVGIDFPACWDGVNVDSPDHRQHMAYASTSGCPADHPVSIPTISVQNYYRIDAAFQAHTWHLATDEMVPNYTPGQTQHADYWEGWSDATRLKWYTNCVLPHNSCTQDFADGTAMVEGAFNYDGSIVAGNGGQKSRPDNYFPYQKIGMSTDVTANGTYTFYLDCPDDGTWGFLGENKPNVSGGFSGTITNVHISDLGVTSKGPVTIHN